MMNIEVYDDSGPIDIHMIDQFEQSIEYNLPESYRNLLSRHNALTPAECIFEFMDRTSGETDTRDITFYGYGDHLPDYRQIGDAQEHDAFGHVGLITIGETANGDFICFDYKSMPERSEPLVVLMFHDRRDVNGKMLVKYVADSFEDFIKILRKGKD